MDARARRRSSESASSSAGIRRPLQHEAADQGRAPWNPNYFGVESFLLLVCLTASLLVLPLVLPPLPPPPSMLLLLPLGLLLVLMVLAFMPSDARNIASPYL